jgi:hypothetical protein
VEADVSANAVSGQLTHLVWSHRPRAVANSAGIPAMDTAMRLPIEVSSATSNFMIGVTAAASAGACFIRGNIVTEVAGPVALGSLLGAIAGERILLIVSNDKLRLLFVVILVVLGIQMLLAVFGVHLSKGTL